LLLFIKDEAKYGKKKNATLKIIYALFLEPYACCYVMFLLILII